MIEEKWSQDSDNGQEVIQDKSQFIKDPYQFLSFCQKDKKIKIMDERNPILPHIYLKDVSLHKKGPLQDKIYAKYPKYFKNIRRGNTLCQVYQDNEPKNLFFCRRGMVKFYDLQPEFLKVNSKLTFKEKLIRNIIFQQLDKILQLGDSEIHLYNLFKENGQHCQISYIHQLDYWVFASKNVSIIAKNENDLKQYYHKERFYWAKLIGQQFFKIINQFSQQQKIEFIHDIKGKTLLGQHCGNQNHQHITNYSKVQIIFYAIVQNAGTRHCISVDQCEKFLKKFNLRMSRMKKIKHLKDKSTVYESMYKLLEQVATGGMDIQGEGSVLYIVAQKQDQQKTISLCKLKTTQYLIFRKLRQMLKIIVSKKGSTANSYKKYVFEIENLVSKYFKPPKPLNVYFKIGQMAFKQVMKEQNQITQEKLRYKFAQFLNYINQFDTQQINQVTQTNQKVLILGLPSFSKSIQNYVKTIKIELQYNFRFIQSTQSNKNIVYLQYMIPRLPQKIPQNYHIIIIKYTDNQVNDIIKQFKQFNNMSISHLITFAKSEDKEKTFNLLITKIRGFQQQCIKENYQFQTVQGINKQDQIIQKLNSIYCSKDKQSQQTYVLKPQFYKYIILPMLIPGSGKSTLCNLLEKYIKDRKIDVNFKIISSDKIRKQVIDNYLQNQKNNLEQDNLYKVSKEQASNYYNKAVQQQLDIIPKTKQIVFIDRVICPTTLSQNITQFYRPYTKIIILAEKQNCLKLSNYEYPFSLRYLLVCLKRCLQRENHQTLTTKPNQIVKVVLKFYQMYRNFNFGKILNNVEENLKQNINVVQLQFVKDDQNKGVNLFLKKKLEQCLSLINPGYDAKDSQVFTQLIQLMYKYSSYLEQINNQQQILTKFCKLLKI